jgi:hypothetical protein
MANQLYAAPIIIEAFQTGKAALPADYGIQSANGTAPSPNNGPGKALWRYPAFVWTKGFPRLAIRAAAVYGENAVNEYVKQDI